MSYQPEERYWTDYLRIALPVVGLLLMLGLFWFWAASLIGDDDDDDPANLAALATETPAPTAVTATQTPPPGAVEGANPAVAGTETPSADGTDEQPGVEDPTGADPNAETADGTEDQTGGTTEDEAEPEADSSGFSEGALVAITSDGARLRSTAESVADNIIETYDTGVEFVVTGPSEEDGDGNIWIPVELGEDPDVTGFISDTLLALSE